MTVCLIDRQNYLLQCERIRRPLVTANRPRCCLIT